MNFIPSAALKQKIDSIVEKFNLADHEDICSAADLIYLSVDNLKDHLEESIVEKFNLADHENICSAADLIYLPVDNLKDHLDKEGWNPPEFAAALTRATAHLLPHADQMEKLTGAYEDLAMAVAAGCKDREPSES